LKPFTMLFQEPMLLVVTLYVSSPSHSAFGSAIMSLLNLPRSRVSR
jgi:hypothetical protein